eukprot:1158085-Pelagomonas_calceolata.AAC.6
MFFTPYYWPARALWAPSCCTAHKTSSCQGEDVQARISWLYALLSPKAVSKPVVQSTRLLHECPHSQAPTDKTFCLLNHMTNLYTPETDPTVGPRVFQHGLLTAHRTVQTGENTAGKLRLSAVQIST